MSTIETLFSFKGRMRRQDWWVWSLSLIVTKIAVAFSINCAIDPGGLLAASRMTSYVIGAESYLPKAVRAGLDILFLWPVLALGMKRLHDLGRSGWPVLAVNAFGLLFPRIPAPYVDWLDDAAPGFITLPIFALIIGAILWVLFDLAFRDGTPGPNRFGPSPKELGAVPVTP